MPHLAEAWLVSPFSAQGTRLSHGVGHCLTLLNCALSAMRRMTLASLRCSLGPRDARKGLSLLLPSLLLFSN